jgi:hypothetical protein
VRVVPGEVGKASVVGLEIGFDVGESHGYYLEKGD